jgi:hypothetical protein
MATQFTLEKVRLFQPKDARQPSFLQKAASVHRRKAAKNVPFIPWSHNNIAELSSQHNISGMVLN